MSCMWKVPSLMPCSTWSSEHCHMWSQNQNTLFILSIPGLISGSVLKGHSSQCWGAVTELRIGRVSHIQGKHLSSLSLSSSLFSFSLYLSLFHFSLYLPLSSSLLSLALFYFSLYLPLSFSLSLSFPLSSLSSSLFSLSYSPSLPFFSLSFLLLNEVLWHQVSAEPNTRIEGLSLIPPSPPSCLQTKGKTGTRANPG